VTRIRLFIGSSTEALPIARAVKAALERQVSEALKDNIEVDLWSEIFDPGQYTMESIEDTAQTCDFAVMIFAPDDVVMSRGVTKLAPRDNVLAELGLFIGYLGRDRAFLLLDADEVVSLPSDLRGITFETYRKRDDNKYEAAVAAACDHFLAAIAKHGRLRHTNPDFEENLRTILKNCRSAFKVDHWAFENTLHGWVNSFKTDSEDFGRGILKIKIDYGLFLTEMYKKATAEIFSTTIPEYLKVWDSPMGKWLLKCQKENKQAHSSRIFVFANEKEITTDAMRVMRCHAENKIEVRVFIDDEDPSFSYIAHRVESDWTFIDGGTAIGVTIEIGRKGGRSTEAHWFFADPVKIAEYKRMKELLYDASVPLEDFHLERAA